MTYRRLMGLVLMVNMLFIGLQLDKHNRFTQLCYRERILQEKRDQLKDEHATLKSELAQLQSIEAIQAYAQAHLHMRPITQEQCKKAPRES